MQEVPEAWLRGPVQGIPPLLQPVAHALVQVLEDIKRATIELTDDQLWEQPAGVASIGFHLTHLAGSTERLFTYARGELLNESQKAALIAEKSPPLKRTAPELIDDVRRSFGAALEQLRTTNASSLTDQRGVGRARAPSTVLGLLFHAAEHAARHAGQIATTAKLISR